jgi:hypothetical protein
MARGCIGGEGDVSGGAARPSTRSLKAHMMANFFKREAQFMMTWQILLPVIAITIGIITVMFLQIHKGPARVASTPAAKSLKVPVASTGFVSPSKGKPPVGEAVEPSNPAPSSIDTTPRTATKTADAAQPAFDREFAAAAAKPYVEAYQRQHPWLTSRTLAWDQYQAISISAPNGSSATGYLGVFFPTIDGANTGFACFTMDGDADHLEPVSWGFGAKVADLIANFRRTPAAGDGCFHILP